jgi:hypothetical protein
MVMIIITTKMMQVSLVCLVPKSVTIKFRIIIIKSTVLHILMS